MDVLSVMDTDALLRVSFGKILASKRERGGARLHKSLMVLNVMRKAKQHIYARSALDIQQAFTYKEQMAAQGLLLASNSTPIIFSHHHQPSAQEPSTMQQAQAQAPPPNSIPGGDDTPPPNLFTALHQLQQSPPPTPLASPTPKLDFTTLTITGESTLADQPASTTTATTEIMASSPPLLLPGGPQSEMMSSPQEHHQRSESNIITVQEGYLENRTTGGENSYSSGSDTESSSDSEDEVRNIDKSKMKGAEPTRKRKRKHSNTVSNNEPKRERVNCMMDNIVAGTNSGNCAQVDASGISQSEPPSASVPPQTFFSLPSSPSVASSIHGGITLSHVQPPATTVQSSPLTTTPMQQSGDDTGADTATIGDVNSMHSSVISPPPMAADVDSVHSSDLGPAPVAALPPPSGEAEVQYPVAAAAGGGDNVELAPTSEPQRITVPIYNLINLLNCHFSQLLRQQQQMSKNHLLLGAASSGAAPLVGSTTGPGEPQHPNGHQSLDVSSFLHRSQSAPNRLHLNQYQPGAPIRAHEEKPVFIASHPAHQSLISWPSVQLTVLH